MAKAIKPAGNDDADSTERDTEFPDSVDPPFVIRTGDEQSLLNVDLSSREFIGETIKNADQRLGHSTSRIIDNSASATVKISSARKELVLVGAGQTHLQVVNRWPSAPIHGVNLTLVSAFDRIVNRKMLPGVLAGLYRPEEVIIDLPRLCRNRGVRLIVDRANVLDPVAREIQFSHQPTLHFDLASVNIGTIPSEESLWKSHRIIISTKPDSTFLSRFQARFEELVEQRKMSGGTEPIKLIVVGAGSVGIEFAFALVQRNNQTDLPAEVWIVDGGTEILNDYHKSVALKVRRRFRKRGIEMILGSRVMECDDLGPPSLILENGNRIRADLVIWSTDATPPNSLQGFQLPKSPKGFLTSRPTLQSSADVPVFVVGDVAECPDTRIKKTQRNHDQQALILQENFRRWFSARPLLKYKPRPSAFSFLSCGDGSAIMSYKGICFRSSLLWWWKRRFDQNSVRRYQSR